MFCVLSLVELAAVRLGITVAPQDKAAFLRIVYLITASAILSILAFGGLLNAPPLRAVFTCGLLASVVAAGYPVVQSMRQWWSEPRAEIAYYVSGGFPITHDGHLTASDIFSRQETSRPPRVEVPTPFQYAWRGYVNGTYMMNDYGPKSISQQMVDANPGVSAVMHRGTELFVANCGTVTCDADNIDGVALDTPSPDARSVVYSRNYIIYRIPVRNRSLVVENEMFAPGWSAVCESHGERLTARRVDGALRGWVLAPGTHRLRAEYRTPMLREAALVSVAAYVAWTLISGWALFILGAHRQRRRCGT